MEFIYDRNQIDRDYFHTLKEKIAKNTATADEKAEWAEAKLKGTYNYTDLNRVGNDLLDLKTRGEAGGFVIDFPTTPKTDWALGDNPTSTQMSNYLTNVAVVADAFEVNRSSLPSTMANLTIEGANAIEQILYHAYQVEPVIRLIDNNDNYLVNENGEILTL